MQISENLTKALSEIQQVEQAHHRLRGSVKLIAVSKTKPLSSVKEAAAAGQVDFGENKVQELVEKHEAFPDLHWHMIGSLQRNKVKYIAPFIHLIHSVDSERLLREIDKQAAKVDRKISCLLQVNISDEAQKGGFTEAEAEAVLKNIDQFPFIQINGLMGMAEFTDDKGLIQSQFKRLRIASERFQALNGPQIELKELSMGMSGDFEIAIAEGATMVRIGSAIFGHR